MKGGEFVAIGREQRRARRPLHHEDPRHRGKEFLADDFLDNGEAALERIHQAHHDVIAIDGKALG